jgi:hypothetical protein
MSSISKLPSQFWIAGVLGNLLSRAILLHRISRLPASPLDFAQCIPPLGFEEDRSDGMGNVH